MNRVYNYYPTVFTETLSYLEKINEIIKWLNELVDINNEFNEKIENNTNAIKVINDFLKVLDSKVDENKAELQEIIQLNYIKMVELIGETSKDLTEYIDNQDLQLKNELTHEINLLTQSLDKKYNELLKLINDLESYNMFSPFTGELTSVTNVITQVVDYITKLHNLLLTANEYDSYNLTASVYDNKNITAGEYDLQAKNYLP